MFRIFRISTHGKMKYNILKTISNETQIDYSKFVDSIASFKRDLKIKKSEFDITILATAAPFCYANIIAKNENFHLCLATNFPDSNFNDQFENIKEMKKNNIIKVLFENKVDKIDTLITDHIDDFPLIKLSEKNWIVNPNNALKTVLKEHQIPYEVIF